MIAKQTAIVPAWKSDGGIPTRLRCQRVTRSPTARVNWKAVAGQTLRSTTEQDLVSDFQDIEEEDNYTETN
jgi:hypothetical protein